MIVLGRLVAPYGVRGWFKLHPFADDPDVWCSLPQWWVATDADAAEPQWRMFELEEVRVHGKGLIAKLADVNDRTAAEALQGSYVAAPREAMPEPEDDEFYWADLVGLEVINQHGVALGRVSELLAAAANDVLVVQQETPEGLQERLLPFVDAVVENVDTEAGRIQVNWEADW